MPKWMSALDKFNALKSAGIAFLFSGINPKNLILTAAATITIASSGLSAGEEGAALAVYILIASITVAAPVLTYLVHAGAHTVQMTGYPGKPVPHQRCELHVYIRRTDTGQPFDSTVTLTVMRDRMIADDPAIYGPIEASLDDALYKFYPEFEEESNYYARIEFEAEGAPWIIDLPIVVGEPGSPWTVLAAIVGGLILFLVVIRAVRIKMNRRAAEVPSSGETAA